MDSDFSRKFEELMTPLQTDELRQEQNRGLDENTRSLKSYVETGT